MSSIKLGVDVGNFDTKSAHCTVPSSFKDYSIDNILNEESIFYNGRYYTPTNERNNQQLDKTENDYCVIISLFAIAKEILFRIKEDDSTLSKEIIQEKIKSITEISLGIGLPVGHLSALARKTVDKYYEKMESGISFKYRYINDVYDFNFKLTKCSAFAQDFTAVAFNHDLTIPMNYEEYYILGIGGGTVDVVYVSKGIPNTDKCFSLDKGTTYLYSSIISAIQQETGKTMEYTMVEAVLLDKNTRIDDRRKTRIKELADEYAGKLVDEIIHSGCTLTDRPSVFIGGGALLLKDRFLNSTKICMSEFVTNTHSNALYYEEFV